MKYAAQVKAAGIGYAPLYIPRHQSAGWSETIIVENEDVTAAEFKAQIRLYPGAEGVALQSMSFGTPTLVGSDTHIPVSIAQANLLALPANEDLGAQIELYWDLWIAGEVWLAGEFFVIQGVSQ